MQRMTACRFAGSWVALRPAKQHWAVLNRPYLKDIRRWNVHSMATGQHRQPNSNGRSRTIDKDRSCGVDRLRAVEYTLVDRGRAKPSLQIGAGGRPTQPVHRRSRIPGLIPCEAVACTIQAAPQNAEGKRSIATAAHDGRSPNWTFARAGKSSKSSATH